jgi:hypothetical protein
MAFLDTYAGPWTTEEAAHLARRAGFGEPPETIGAMAAAGMDAAVDALVDYAPVDQALEDLIAALPGDASGEAIKNPLGFNQLQGWWLFRMVHANQPLQEQFTLFCHDHFASDWGKVASGVPLATIYGNDGSDPANQTCETGTLAPDSTRKDQIWTYAKLRVSSMKSAFGTVRH